jgi:hypothetical protein
MSLVRTILVALVALSVAVLPVAGGMARADMSHDMTLSAGEGDCCPHGKSCEKKTNDCGSMAGCVLKCFNYPGTVTAPNAVALTSSALEKFALIVPGVPSPSDNPPLPPPRV